MELTSLSHTKKYQLMAEALYPSLILGRDYYDMVFNFIEDVFRDNFI
jgi:hypothetical protein